MRERAVFFGSFTLDHWWKPDGESSANWEVCVILKSLARCLRKTNLATESAAARNSAMLVRWADLLASIDIQVKECTTSPLRRKIIISLRTLLKLSLAFMVASKMDSKMNLKPIDRKDVRVQRWVWKGRKTALRAQRWWRQKALYFVATIHAWKTAIQVINLSMRKCFQSHTGKR